MRFKSFLLLFIILLALSFLLSSASVQATRRLLPNKEKLPIQISSVKGVEELRSEEEMFDEVQEFMVEGRIDLESNDYPGTGANNRHDPKTPGTP